MHCLFYASEQRSAMGTGKQTICDVILYVIALTDLFVGYLVFTNIIMLAKVLKKEKEKKESVILLALNLRGNE